MPLHRQSGFPSASCATIKPTYGWRLPSSSPSVIALAGTASTSSESTTSMSSRLSIIRSPFSIDPLACIVIVREGRCNPVAG